MLLKGGYLRTSQQTLTADPSNTRQVQAWDGAEGAFWTAQAQRFDESLGNVHGAFLAAAAMLSSGRMHSTP